MEIFTLYCPFPFHKTETGGSGTRIWLRPVWWKKRRPSLIGFLSKEAVTSIIHVINEAVSLQLIQMNTQVLNYLSYQSIISWPHLLSDFFFELSQSSVLWWPMVWLLAIGGAVLQVPRWNIFQKKPVNLLQVDLASTPSLISNLDSLRSTRSCCIINA